MNIKWEKFKNKKQMSATQELGIKGFAPPMVSGANPMVANMISTGGLHGR